MNIQQRLQQQIFANGYELIDGVAMHQQNGDRFQIPHPVLKKHVAATHFVEVRIDSTRFSVHQDAPEKCMCSSCNGETSKPILSHEHPATMCPLPAQDVPSRGWGEDFWVQVAERDGDVVRGIVDNPLYESRFHEIRIGDEILLHMNHVLAIHPIHRQQMVLGMDEADVRQLVEWLGTL